MSSGGKETKEGFILDSFEEEQEPTLVVFKTKPPLCLVTKGNMPGDSTVKHFPLLANVRDPKGQDISPANFQVIYIGPANEWPDKGTRSKIPFKIASSGQAVVWMIYQKPDGKIVSLAAVVDSISDNKRTIAPDHYNALPKSRGMFRAVRQKQSTLPQQ